MAVATEKYARKPLIVDAVKVTKDNFEEVAAWCMGDIREPEGEPKYIRVRVHKPTNPRQTKAQIGDWILYTEAAGYKVYTHKSFKSAFEKVEGESKEATVKRMREELVDMEEIVKVTGLTEDEIKAILKPKVQAVRSQVG